MKNNYSVKQTRRELQLVLKCCLETKRLYLIEIIRRQCLNFIQFAFGDITTTNVQLYTALSSSESFSSSKVSLQMHIDCLLHLDDNRTYSVSTQSYKKTRVLRHLSAFRTSFAAGYLSVNRCILASEVIFSMSRITKPRCLFLQI